MRQPIARPARSARPVHLLRTLCISGLLAGAGAAFAATPAAAPAKDDSAAQAAQARYAKERAACMDGSSNQDRPTCLREAGAARDEALKGLTPGTDAATLQRNAVDRCKTQPAGEQAACRDRITGQGVTSGSVQSGGILRERVEVVPAPVTPATAPKPAVSTTEPVPTK